MKLSIQNVEFEGTPEELLEADLREVFVRRSNGHRLSEPNADSPRGLPHDVQDWLGEEIPAGEIRDTAAALLAEAVTWDSVETARGTGVGRRYMRLYRRGTPAGAFAYVQPRKIHFRLPGSAATGRRYARARDVQARNPHQVTVTTITRESLPEIVELAREAFDHAAE